MKPNIVTSDFTEDFKKVIERFRNDEVLIGIPEEDTDRKKSEGVNNATLLALNEFGSPLNNIPARPVMEVGIRNAQESIAQEFKKAAIESLTSGTDKLDLYYNRAGIIASNSVKKAINDQDGIEGPSEATLAHRRSMGFKGEKALVVTGQMRNAITYAVRKK